MLSTELLLGIILAVLVCLVVVASMRLRKSGYRGAIGFKNRHATEIATIRLTGLSRPVDCRTLARGEHSFNYLGRQNIPPEAQIAWRFVGDTADRTARVALSAVPKGATDGEPQLQLDKLQRGE